jgi:hypothetical protein
VSDNPKPNTIPVASENATSGRLSRPRLLIALLNLALLPILAALFLAAVSKRQMQPMYSWIEDTPLATIGDRLANLFGGQAFSFARGLEIDRRDEAEALVARMIARMPTHTIVTADSSIYYGQLTRRDEQKIQLSAVDGRLNETAFISVSELRLNKPLVHPEVELDQRDAHFMLRHENLRHFCLSPLLVATDEGYTAAHNAYLSLSLLEEAFLEAFAAIVDHDATRQRLLHVVVKDSPASTAKRDIHHAANADAWYDSDLDVLVVAANADADNLAAYLRHEGAHELCRRYAVLGEYSSSPIWLREGIAQFCETAPFGRTSRERMRPLTKRRIPWEELLRPRSLETMPEELNDATFYAQSLFLVKWLMKGDNRPRFFRYLADNRATPDNLADTITLMNALDTTIAQLDADLDAFLRISPPPPTTTP